MNFSIEESKEHDLIKQQPETPERKQSETFLFSLTLQAARINNQGAPLLGLAKSI